MATRQQRISINGSVAAISIRRGMAWRSNMKASSKAWHEMISNKRERKHGGVAINSVMVAWQRQRIEKCSISSAVGGQQHQSKKPHQRHEMANGEARKLSSQQRKHGGVAKQTGSSGVA